jgi:ubiquinol-cytochrome c reductase cytochrome b subunit
MQAPTPTYTNLARLGTVIYFAFFLLLPWLSKVDKTKPVPERVTYHA